ncbi:hypothetical protein JVU11DRAFT_9157 [Chiua virens]|nr:hypothetical protein JVU11DRAFT_9157 [Chiua virens]
MHARAVLNHFTDLANGEPVEKSLDDLKELATKYFDIEFRSRDKASAVIRSAPRTGKDIQLKICQADLPAVFLDCSVFGVVQGLCDCESFVLQAAETFAEAYPDGVNSMVVPLAPGQVVLHKVDGVYSPQVLALPGKLEVPAILEIRTFVVDDLAQEWSHEEAGSRRGARSSRSGGNSSGSRSSIRREIRQRTAAAIDEHLSDLDAREAWKTLENYRADTTSLWEAFTTFNKHIGELREMHVSAGSTERGVLTEVMADRRRRSKPALSKKALDIFYRFLEKRDQVSEFVRGATGQDKVALERKSIRGPMKAMVILLEVVVGKIQLREVHKGEEGSEVDDDE